MYRMFGMDASEIVLYRWKYFRPTYQWIAMMKMIIIDVLSMGHDIIWLAPYEGLKVVLRTIILNLSRVSFNAHPRSRRIFFTLGVRVEHFL